MQMVRTAVLVCIGELFFRAQGLMAGFLMFRKMLTDFSLATLLDKTFFTFGMDAYDYFVVLVAALIIFVIGIFQEKKISIRERIAARNIVVRYAVCLLYTSRRV